MCTCSHHGPVGEASGHASRRPPKRIRDAYLGRFCISPDSPVTMRWADGLGCRHIFWPHGRKRSLRVLLRRAVGDPLSPKEGGSGGQRHREKKCVNRWLHYCVCGPLDPTARCYVVDGGGWWNFLEAPGIWSIHHHLGLQDAIRWANLFVC
jgi:hypothetical protein